MSTKIFAFTALLSLVSAIPKSPSCVVKVETAYVVVSPTATAVIKHEITQPRSYNIYPQSPKDIEDKVPHIDLKKEKGRGTVTTNAIAFDDVPANAKNCQLNWRTDGKDGTSGFFVKGSGLIYSRQLLGFPEEGVPVTSKSLAEFQNNATEFSAAMDTTGWEGTIDSHTGPSLDCSEQVAVEMYGDKAGGEDDRIFIANTETNGMYLTYEL